MMEIFGKTMIEKFYVYRELGDESKWGALILGDNLADRLPSLAFGMRVFAKNEKEAISKAKEVYDRAHAFDSDKENIRRFASSALKGYIEVYGAHGKDGEIADRSMSLAVKMNERYNEYFKGR